MALDTKFYLLLIKTHVSLFLYILCVCVCVCVILGFLEKNRDTFSADLVQLIQSSKSKFINTLFESDITMVSDY